MNNEIFFLNKIEEVSEYLAHNDNLLYKKKNSDKQLYNFDGLIENDNWGYGFSKDFMYFNYEHSTKLVHNKTQKVFDIPVVFNGTNFYDNTFIISENVKREGRGLYSGDYIICQLFPFKRLYKLPHRYFGSGYRNLNLYIQIQNKRTLIRSLSLITGEYSWQYDLSILGVYTLPDGEEKNYEVVKFLGVWEDELLVFLKNNTVISLDITSGDIAHQWHQIEPQEMREYTIDTLGDCISYDALENEVVSFHFFTCTKIDMKSKLLTTYNMADTFEENNVHSIANTSEFASDATHYYLSVFTHHATLSNTLSAALVAINKKSMHIDWLHTFDDDVRLGVNFPQAEGGKLYQLDKNHTLHIFEKETA